MNNFSLILTVILVFTKTFSSTDLCLEEPDFYQFISGDHASGSVTRPNIHFLPCDTMVVQKGMTASFSSNSYLTFADPNASNIIIVEGSLILSGSSDAKVRVSSSLDTASLNAASMEGPWNGFLVRAGGTLIMDNALIYGAFSPIVSNSDDVRIKATSFFGAEMFTIQDSIPYVLNQENMDDFYLKDWLTSRQVADEPMSINSEKEGRTSLFKSPYLYAGIAGVVAAGTVSYFVFAPVDEKQPVKQGTLLLGE